MAVAGLLAATLVVGVAGPAQAILPAGPTETGLTGARPSATRLLFPVSDQVVAEGDVATGNLLVSSSDLALPGAVSPVRIGQAYNSLSDTVGSTSNLSANRWTISLDGAGYLSLVGGTVVYTGGDGATWVFTPVPGSSTSFSSPPGLKADLVAEPTGYTLTDRTSRKVIRFDGEGLPVSIADRNDNTTTVGYTNFSPVSVLSSAGPVAARTAALSYSPSTYALTVSQSSGGLSRQVQYVKDASSNLVSIVNANGTSTSFGYSGSRMTSITGPTGGVTAISYGATGKVEQIAQANTSVGSPGTSTTRFFYSSGTETDVAGPNTDQTVAVANVPHSSYTFDAATRLVTGVVDAMGRVRAASYTPNADVASFTVGSGATAGTRTATYGANSGESLTRQEAPGGASRSAAYGNTAAATKYLPSSVADDAGNGSTFTYNGSGNAVTSTDALAATATLTYNGHGQVIAAAAPGNGSNDTDYAYDVNGQLVTVTPVTGTSLGVRTFTYDGFGRVATATNGRGTTLTYGYDRQDRLLTTSFSDGTPTVTNTYTDAGQPKTRIDGNGTTTYGYDQLGRLISRVNTAGGGTIGYRYDRASNLTATVDTRGTTTNAFDDSGVPTEITYAHDGATQVLGFATDNQGCRTDSWLETNPGRTVWAAHTGQEYDSTGRVSRAFAQTGPATSPTTTMDVSYCYNSASPAPTCSSGTSTDRVKLQWAKDNLTGQVTSYRYDGAGRLTEAAQSGGTGANTYAYTYDVRGNRSAVTVTGATPSSQSFTVNAGNQITNAGYSFDGTGNMTADPLGFYAYNGAEQMTTVTQGANVSTYTYAGTTQNEVLTQQQAGSRYDLAYGRANQQGQPVVEQITTGGATAYVENDPVTGQPLMLRTSAGAQSLYVYSGTGSPTGLLTDSGTVSYMASYDPFGVATLTGGGADIGASQNVFQFAGGTQDRATGWVKFGARWYNPSTGRWTQQDTLDNPLDPVNANRYAYAGNDPTNNIDPTGRYNFKRTAVVGLAGAVGGAITGCVGGAVAGSAALGAGAIPGCLGGIAGGFVTGFVVGAVGDAIIQAFGY